MSAIRMQERTPVAVKVMGQGHRRRVLLTAQGRLAFPDAENLTEVLAEGAYAAMGGNASRSYTVLKEWRRICANGNVSRALPKPLFLAAMDGFAVNVLREITRTMSAGQQYTRVDRHRRRFFSEHCRRAFRHCFVTCHYPNYNAEAAAERYLLADNAEMAGRVPRFCDTDCGCRAGFNAVKNTGVGQYRQGYTHDFGFSIRITLDWSWYRDLYLRGLAVVENHLVLRYLEAISPTLHRVTVVVQQKGVNRFTEEERLIWQTGEGLLLLRS